MSMPMSTGVRGRGGVSLDTATLMVVHEVLVIPLVIVPQSELAHALEVVVALLVLDVAAVLEAVVGPALVPLLVLPHRLVGGRVGVVVVQVVVVLGGWDAAGLFLLSLCFLGFFGISIDGYMVLVKGLVWSEILRGWG